MVRRGATVEDIKQKDDGVHITVRLQEEDAAALIGEKKTGEYVSVGMEDPEQPDDAAAYIREALRKMGKKTGRDPEELKHELMARGGAPLRVAGKKAYILVADDEFLKVARALYTRRSRRADIKPSWICGELIKAVNEHHGEELKRLLETLQEMQTEMGLPKEERLTPRLIQFFVDKDAEEERGRDNV